MQTLPTSELDIGRCFSESFSVWMRHFVALSLASVAAVVLSAATASLLLGSLYAGLLMMILKGMRGGKPRFRDVFSYIRRFPRLFCITWYAVIMTTIGLVLLIAPGILFGVWCFYMYLLAADRDAPLDEAFVESRKAVRRYGFKKHLLLLIFALLIVFGSGVTGQYQLADVLPMGQIILGPLKLSMMHLVAVLFQPFALGLLASAYHQTLEVEALRQKLHREEFEVMRNELQTAHDMQMGLLPGESPHIPGYALDGVCIPANNVGGDYFAYRWLDDEKTRLAIVAADVSGKAMEAAVTALRFNEMLRYECRGRTSPADILDGLNESLEGQIDMATFITCCIAVLNTRDHTIEIANGGHCLPYHYRHQDGQAVALDITGFPLGLPALVRPDDPYDTLRMTLHPGDAIFLYSDGVVEAQDVNGEFYDEERFADWLRTTGGGTDVTEMVHTIVRSVDRFMGNAPRTDDVTLIGLKRKQSG